MFVLALLLIHGAAYGQSDVRYITGLSLGYSQFEFPEKLDHEVSFPSANLLLAASLDEWQMSLNGAFTLSDANVSEEEERGNASRTDFDLTIGRKLVGGLSLFAGYKRGESKIAFIDREAEDQGNVAKTRESYKFSGPYAGASYSWKFDKAGSLSLSLAYALLSADNVFAANVDGADPADEIEFDDISGRNKGDLDGFSYALAWTMPVSGQVLFQTKFRINDYQMDIEFNDRKFNNVDQTFSSLHVGLAYVF
jgi:hypothetical protein